MKLDDGSGAHLERLAKPEEQISAVPRMGVGEHPDVQSASDGHCLVGRSIIDTDNLVEILARDAAVGANQQRRAIVSHQHPNDLLNGCRRRRTRNGVQRAGCCAAGR